MWIYVIDEPIPTYGKHGQKFLLCLSYKKHYGHNVTEDKYETVTAVWDSINECFYETETMLEIDSREIVEWWKDI